MADLTPNLTLNPEEVSLDVPTMGTVSPVGTTEYAAGAIDESMLTDEEKAQVEQFAQSIDLTDTRQVMVLQLREILLTSLHHSSKKLETLILVKLVIH